MRNPWVQPKTAAAGDAEHGRGVAWPTCPQHGEVCQRGAGDPVYLYSDGRSIKSRQLSFRLKKQRKKRVQSPGRPQTRLIPDKENSLWVLFSSFCIYSCSVLRTYSLHMPNECAQYSACSGSVPRGKERSGLGARAPLLSFTLCACRSFLPQLCSLLQLLFSRPPIFSRAVQVLQKR